MNNLPRLESIDLMRGLVMALMALDHTRDFFSSVLFDPTDLSKTYPALFLTRWITHLCAPTFVFLTGVSAYLSTVRRKLTNRQLAWYLFSRGLWLIFLELTLVRFGWTFNWDYHSVAGAVIWALGCSMMVLSCLVFLPRWAIALFALTTIVGHNQFDAIKPEDMQGLSWLWMILHSTGSIEYLPGYFFKVLYPLIPWIGLMAMGYFAGPLFLQAPAPRKKILLLSAVGMAGIFLLLRLNNIYGDPRPWLPQKDSVFTLFAVVNCQKYPPSLLYLLMTLSPMFLGLALFESIRPHRLTQALIIIGKVPLFFYLIHLPLIHGAALLFEELRGLPTDWLFGGSPGYPFPEMPAPEYGYNLATVYIVWLLLLILIYPVCKAFAGYKQRRREWVWLSYL